MAQPEADAGVTPSRIERVERSRLSDSVAAQLTQLITENAYRIGEKLPSERILSEQFGVSRSSMREAIRSLETNGLVSSTHGVGVFVINNKVDTPAVRDLMVFDDFTVAELFEIRRTLEGDASALAARRMTPSDVVELDRILTDCTNPELSNERFVELDVQLHQTAVRAARNRLMSRLYHELEPLLIEYSRRVIALPGRRETAHQGHIRIVEAMKSGDPTAARRAALAHIHDVEDDISRYLAEAE